MTRRAPYSDQGVGTAAGGQGTAAAKAQAILTEDRQDTTVGVIIDLTITG